MVTELESGKESFLPFSSVDGISVFGKAQLSAQLIRECIVSNVPIGYYSEDGRYFGKTSSLEHVDPFRQKRQAYLTDDTLFRLTWSQRIVHAKIRNSIALLESMSGTYCYSQGELKGLHHSLRCLDGADSVEMVVGFEGNAAKCYFQCLTKLVCREEFVFKGRSARPPRDAFNSMLSYGYSLLLRNIVGAIERHGLHPYFGYMHKLKQGHAALASDLIEEYRAPLVDSLVLDLVNSGKVDPTGFYKNEAGSVWMTRDTAKMVADAFSERIVKGKNYFHAYGDNKSYGFQAMLDKKINSVVEAIDTRNAEIYQPFLWNPES